jgi:RNA polymerase sigma-70 factor (ECF subfamily)
MRLPEAQRATVFLVYVEGYSYHEAAELLDITVGTVMSRLAGARGRLAQALGDGSAAAPGQGDAETAKNRAVR